MAVWSFIEFNTPDTQILSDLQGVAGDLQAVEEVCKAFLNLPQDTRCENILIRESLCAAAIIRYGRSFSTGVRRWDQGGIISKLENRLSIAHSYFIELRNKWIAHSVNAFEENSVQVYLTPTECGPRGIASINVSQNRVICLGNSDMAALSELAGVVRAEVEKTLELEKEEVRSILEKIAIDTLYEKLGQPPKPLANQHYSKRRTSR